VTIVENWISLPDVSKAGNIQTETEAIESLSDDRDSNSDSEKGLDIKRLKEIKCYIF
jgi:hypothetical protein